MRRAVARAALAAALLPGASCSSSDEAPSGELVVVVGTDLAPPRDFDTLHLEIVRGGVAYHQANYAFDGDLLRLPATLPVTQGTKSQDEVVVKVVAMRNGVARVARTARSTIPASRSAMLRMGLSWLCLDRVSGEGKDAVASCPSGQTCRVGGCASDEEPEANLPDYVPQLVFGGGTAAGEGGCFDTLGCFAQGAKATDLRTSDCTIAVPTSASGPSVGVNVALAGPPSTEGVCATSGGCLVPLDQDQREGWFEYDGRVHLPSMACQSPRTVVVTTSCSSKTASLPTCGAWSSTSPDSTGSSGVTLPFALRTPGDL